MALNRGNRLLWLAAVALKKIPGEACATGGLTAEAY
jgi:hypothetical protein